MPTPLREMDERIEKIAMRFCATGVSPTSAMIAPRLGRTQSRVADALRRRGWAGMNAAGDYVWVPPDHVAALSAEVGPGRRVIIARREDGGFLVEARSPIEPDDDADEDAERFIRYVTAVPAPGTPYRALGLPLSRKGLEELVRLGKEALKRFPVDVRDVRNPSPTDTGERGTREKVP